MRISSFQDGALFKYKNEICYKTQFQDYTLLVIITGARRVLIVDRDLDVLPIKDVKLTYITEVTL